MDIQEEIREWLATLFFPDKQQIEWEWGSCEDDTAKEDSYELADKVISYLHSQGVVLKVDRELPNDEWLANLKNLIDPGSYYYFKEWTAIDRGKTVGERQVTSYLAEAGYVAVEPLIKPESSNK